ncbi:cation-translocating P-type ATPase [Emticicia sp. BO119]|uniref:cation-translocating P-type ATPase n=1 Tax=Emticicia sp. BO119 TaxID=2757768 RepID=UPI0015F0C859|nr:cation-translocating P-type ATPase [Emticicia sp. BO119]MBA4848967.1 cation-translocating P-type ATPase [Emticicia sp. BO119]
MINNLFNIQGLSNEEVLISRQKHGANQLIYKKENDFIRVIKSLIKEPMIILLLATSCIYFINGSISDGVFLASAIILVSLISIYQDTRSLNALEKLKNYSQSTCKVIRNGEVIAIPSEELVIGDKLVVEEGTSVTADGIIIHANDFSVNESILTGESLPVFKDHDKQDHFIYQGTTVSSGLAIATITAIGNKTRLGQIGKSIENIEEEKTPLELQINNFVKMMIFVGLIIFIIVWLINYITSHHILDSLLQALTLAMSILPEEIPVAFTTFMALGAWRLMKTGIIVKQMKTVETLGSATVICTDKTGTLTENKMSLADIFVVGSQKITNPDEVLSNKEKELIKLAMFASEPIPFDPMEIALHNAYVRIADIDERQLYKMIHEYPLEGKPPMMTHLFENGQKDRIIVAKGAPEAIMSVCYLTATEKKQIEESIRVITSNGYRVLGVGEANFEGTDFPEKQQDFKFTFKGIVSFYDPPKKNIPEVLKSFYEAGIEVKIITGDNAATTAAIARQIAFKGYEQSISGDQLMQLSETDLQKVVKETNLYTRMFPEAKLRIINALKRNHEIVAMTGDGVNDGPALKAAHIGIAMGKKGTEIAKQAASLILLEDDLSRMVDAIAIGRKIYANLKKAIQYIISIHIPIILTVFLPLVLGWIYPNIFSPVHIIFLELIMGPTCSIIYENEPIEKNTMIQKPRPFTNTFFNWKELINSISQGFSITAGTLFIYQYATYQGFNESITRTMVFITLIAANIFLTLENRSFYYSVFTTMRYKNNLIAVIISITVILTGLILYIKPLSDFFQFYPPTLSQLSLSVVVGFTVVVWFEIIKLGKRMRLPTRRLNNS